MEIKTRTRSLKRLFGLSAIFVYLGFVIAVALPGIVFCHRPDGKIAVEFAGPTDTCACRECEHCLERLARGLPKNSPDEAVFTDCHCTHESILLAPDRSVARRSSGLKMPAASGCEGLSPVSVKSPCLMGPFEAGLFRPVLPPIPGKALDLRC